MLHVVECDGELRIVLYAILIGSCYTSIMLDKGISSDLPRQVALRYWTAPDNVIPKIFADAMISGNLKNNAAEPGYSLFVPPVISVSPRVIFD